MLSVYGMSEKLPNLSLADSSAGGYLGQGPQLAPHSGGIAQALDDEEAKKDIASLDSSRGFTFVQGQGAV